MTEGMGLDAPITGVTVFRDGARVQRSGTVSMAPGRQAVVIGGLPAGLDPASVRIAARGPGLTLLNVEVHRGYRADPLREEVARLRAEGSLTPADSLGTATFNTANGKVQGERFLLRSLQVGSRTVYKVVGSVTYSTAGEEIMLLGQTFLRKFKSWSIDNGKAELVLE